MPHRRDRTAHVGITAQRLQNAYVERALSAKRRWCVSAMAPAQRFQKPELLSEWRRTQTVKELAQMGYRKSEPNQLSCAKAANGRPRSPKPFGSRT
jgi:hypothetical protein